MTTTDILTGRNIKKSFGSFSLDIPELHIPQGYATALIGENGAGKTTLLNILSGLRLDFSGDVTYFGEYRGVESDPSVKEAIGYTGTNHYYLPHWTINQVRTLYTLLFTGFHPERFDRLTDELALDKKGSLGLSKKVSELSDGNQTKLMLCGALARDTRLLLLDEPASPLDPLMRDALCDLLRSYIAEGDGKKSVFFSTHNIADMENATDYAIFMADGAIVEEGFVEDLKERFISVKGDKADASSLRPHLYSMSESGYGFTGIIRSDDLERLSGRNVATETATLTEISLAILKRHTHISLGTEAA